MLDIKCLNVCSKTACKCNSSFSYLTNFHEIFISINLIHCVDFLALNKIDAWKGSVSELITTQHLISKW